MILIIAAAQDAHLPYVLPKLDALGADYFHFDPQDFPARAQISVQFDQHGKMGMHLTANARVLDLAQVKSVWNRARVRPQADAQVAPEQKWWCEETSTRFLAELYECLDCFWLPERPASEREPFRASNPARKQGGANPTRQQQASPHNKLFQLRLAGALGFAVPKTIVTNQPQQLLDFYHACDGNIISKRAIALATYRDGERVQCFTQSVTPRALRQFQSVRFAPVVFQEKVAKHSELRVTVVGQQIFAAEISSQENSRLGTDWRHYPEFGGERYYRVHRLPTGIVRRCLALCAELGLSYGALDLILTPQQEYVFLEINPGGQWAWIEEYTGLPISDAIAQLLYDQDKMGETRQEGTSDD